MARMAVEYELTKKRMRPRWIFSCSRDEPIILLIITSVLLKLRKLMGSLSPDGFKPLHRFGSDQFSTLFGFFLLTFRFNPQLFVQL